MRTEIKLNTQAQSEKSLKKIYLRFTKKRDYHYLERNTKNLEQKRMVSKTEDEDSPGGFVRFNFNFLPNNNR